MKEVADQEYGALRELLKAADTSSAITELRREGI
jgi:hypothetical protein